jgi:outer membrane receptor protein involved in Fe transport
MQRLVCVGCAVLLVFGAALAHAQETTGSIAGRIVDAQELAIPGATVTVTGPQGSKTVVTDNQGRYSVPFLVPGTYTVHAELQGFKPIDRPNIQVQLSQTTTLPLTMQIGTLSETVQVTGQPSPIDTTSTTVGATIDSSELNALPTGRRFSDTLYLAPGVSSSGTTGRANPSVNGSSGLENEYVVDGVNLTNGGYGALGSYSIVFGSLGNGTPYDFMQQVQVKTGGYSAQYGEATGGVINVVTKSGSNNLHGSLFGYTQPSGLESAYQTVKSVNGTVNTTGNQASDGGATVGGPIMRDKLFFFGAVDPEFSRATLVAPPNFPLASLGGVNRTRRIINYATKGTWQITPSQRLDVSAFGDPAHGPNGPQRMDSLLRTTTSGFSELSQYGGHNQSIHYDGVLSPTFLAEATVSHALNRIAEVPSVNSWSVTDYTVTPNLVSGGIGFYEAGNRSNSWQFDGNLTNVFDGGGQHELKYGVSYDHLNYDQINQRTGPTFTTPTGQQTATGAEIAILPDPVYGQIYRVVRANLNSARNTSQNYVAAFVQDTWRLGDSITIKPGLRYEQEKLAGTIVNNFTLKNNWAPRIGVTWDPTGTGRAKVFGNYGRYYARVPNDLAARALSADAGITADYFDPNLTEPIPNGVFAGNSLSHYSLLGAGADTIDPNAKLSYYNEYIVGSNYELVQGLNLGVQFVHRDIGRVLEDVQPYPVVAYSLGIASNVNYVLTNPGPNTQVLGGLGASFEAPIHNYNAIQFTAQKRMSHHWSVLASYTYSRLRGTYEGFYREDNGQSDPGITSLYDFPTNDPSYTQIGVPMFGYQGDIRYLGALGSGPLPLDRPHEIKLYGTYQFPRNITASLGLHMVSGTPLTGLAANPVYDNGGEIPLTPRGAGFMTSNGFQTRTPFETSVDAQASYTLRVGSNNLVLLADAFNILNRQTITSYDNFYESQFGVLNPDYGLAGVSGVVQGQQFLPPRQIRLGARFEF